MVRRFAAGAALAALMVLAPGAGAVQAEEEAAAVEGVSLAHLAGRWQGQGTVTPPSGPSESFRCVITYFMSDGSSQMKQNVRCQNANFKFDAATRLQISGAQVTGVWMDNVYALNGTVSGKITDKGFEVQLNGRFFQAKMTVVGSGCEQQVRVVPGRADYMKEMAAVLKKC